MHFHLFYYLETFLKCSTFEKRERNICEDADLHLLIFVVSLSTYYIKVMP